MAEPLRSVGARRLEDAATSLEIDLPDRIRDLYMEGDGRYREEGEWWVVWPLDRVVSENQRSWSDGTLDRAFLAIGDDGTGNPFCVPIDGTDRVERWSWIDGVTESSIGNLSTFLEEWAPHT